MQSTSKNPSHDESAEPFPPEHRSDSVTKIFRIALADQLYARIFVWIDEKSSRRSPHDVFLEMPYSKYDNIGEETHEYV